MRFIKPLKIVEQNHLSHFVFLPKKLRSNITDLHGVTLIHSKVQTSMFNIAYGAPQGFNALNCIQQIKQAFNGQPFAWWIPPSQHNVDVTRALLANNFIIETIEHAMICNLADVSNIKYKTDLCIQHVTDQALLADWISVLERYDPFVRGFYKKMSHNLLQLEEKLIVGYVSGKPVSIAILFVNGNSAGVFSLITNEEMRGKGYGTDMMCFLISVAKQKACQYVTLSASSESGYRIYERLGFRKIGVFECFEYKPDKA